MLASDTEIKLMALTERRQQLLEAERPPAPTLRRRTSGVGRRSDASTPQPSSAKEPSIGATGDTPATTAAASAAEGTAVADEEDDFGDEVGACLAGR